MEKNRNTILVFYAVLSLVVILCSLPSMGLQQMGLTLATVELIVAYIARSRFPKNDSFEENHTTYVIRTIWMYSFLFVIGAVIASYLIFMQGNQSAVLAMAESIQSGIQPTEADMAASAAQYAQDNAELIIRQTRLWLCPSQLYLVWRILQGGSRAFKGYRIAKPKSWI